MIINLPNGLTILRALLTPVVVALLLYDAFTWALIVFVLAGITDGLDGFLARSLRERTEFGRILDPVADKVLLGSAFITLAAVGRLPAWLVAIGVGRDILLVVGSCVLYAVSGRLGYPPSAMGKGTTVLQVLTVLAAMTTPEGGLYRNTLIWATAAVTVISGLDYLYRGVVELIARSRNASPA
jgi:cardiolipin synthase (CMP-forming)